MVCLTHRGLTFTDLSHSVHSITATLLAPLRSVTDVCIKIKIIIIIIIIISLNIITVVSENESQLESLRGVPLGQRNSTEHKTAVQPDVSTRTKLALYLL